MRPNATNSIARVFVDEVLESGHRAGINVAALLHDLGLVSADLDRLTAEDFARLWLEISAHIGDEFFGLAARPMAPGSFTLMGHAVRGAANFEIGLKRALRFLRVVLEDPYGTVQIHDGLCHVSLEERHGPRSPFAYRTFFLILHGLNCWLVRERIPLRRIDFPCRAPSALNDYGDFFGHPVSFDAPKAAIAFDAQYLSRPVQRSEASLKAFLRTTPQSFLAGYRPILGLKAQIQDVCLTGPYQDWPSTGQIADRLGLSRSTLHRRLQDEGLSIRLIKQEKRRTYANYLLKSTDLPIRDIAELTGYAEPSAFHRSFRKWYAATPSEVRRSASEKT